LSKKKKDAIFINSPTNSFQNDGGGYDGGLETEDGDY